MTCRNVPLSSNIKLWFEIFGIQKLEHWCTQVANRDGRIGVLESSTSSRVEDLLQQVGGRICVGHEQAMQIGPCLAPSDCLGSFDGTPSYSGPFRGSFLSVYILGWFGPGLWFVTPTEMQRQWQADICQPQATDVSEDITAILSC